MADPTVPLFITAGEDQAFRADQAGIACVPWSRLLDSDLLPDLDRVAWGGREVFLIPSSGAWSRLDLLRPAYVLGRELAARGARVAVVRLPAGPSGTAVGLGDFLSTRSVAELKSLPKYQLTHSMFLKSAEWWKRWGGRKAAAETGPIGGMGTPRAGDMACDPDSVPLSLLRGQRRGAERHMDFHSGLDGGASGDAEARRGARPQAALRTLREAAADPDHGPAARPDPYPGARPVPPAARPDAPGDLHGPEPQRPSEEKGKEETLTHPAEGIGATGGRVPPEGFLTLREAAKILRLHPKTVAEYVRRGELDGRLIGRRWRFRREDIEAFFDAAPSQWEFLGNSDAED